ncbi:hypothetical protein WJX79_010578 [Trebouxia sp. C0005]
MRRVTPAWSPSQGRSLAIRRFAAQNANSSAQPSALSPLTAALIAHTLRGVNDASVGLSITVLIWSRSERLGGQDVAAVGMCITVLGGVE